MYSVEEDYYIADSRSTHSESLGQVARNDLSYETYVLGNDKPNAVAKLVPHPPLKEKMRLLRRTHSNPEGSEGTQINILPALKDKRTTFSRMGKLTEDLATLGMTGNRTNELMLSQRIPENGAETTDNARGNPIISKKAHKKLERSKTTPVSFLKPVLKTNPRDVRRHLLLSNVRGYSMDDQHSSSKTHNNRNACFNEGCSDIGTRGLFKELEKTYGMTDPCTSPMLRALPNGRRFGSARIYEKYKEEEPANTVVSTTPNSSKIRSSGLREKHVPGKFTRTGKLTGLQFVDENQNVKRSGEPNNIIPEDSSDLTYLRFTKERQEDNRI